MKKKKFFILSVLFILCACKSLTSVTSIEVNKSFVLGEGKHGSYSARIKNVGSDLIEVLIIDINKNSNSLGLLKVNQSATYQVLENNTVQFKNLSTSRNGIIEIKANGDTNLTMGYKNN